VATDICQYCGVDLDAVPPRHEQGWVYAIACSACPPDRRRHLALARPAPVTELSCPDCGARLAPAERHPDVLMVKELTYEVCAACGERCGVAAVRKLRDLTG
jgi:hypothetical protein